MTADHSDFIVTCIAMSVGLGNVWRFPFMVYENGGGAFVVAYIIVVCILGIPLYFLEVAIGQFSGKGSLKLFNSLAPAFTGIGALQTFCSILVASYYCPLLAIILYYFVNSSWTLPWARCYPQYQDICVGAKNSTDKVNMTSSSELFFTKYLFEELNSLDHGIGMIDGGLALAMLATWSGIFFVSTNAVKTGRNFHYYIGLFPYFNLFIMLGIALAQKGSAKGLQYLFSPEWCKLLGAKVWFNAICQCFYSLGFGFGVVNFLASYNSFNSGIYAVSIVVPVIDTCISLLYGITVFAILGNMAERLNTEVGEVIRSKSIGILFITYPDTLGNLTYIGAQIVTVLCFTMIYALGFGSLVAIQQVVNRQIMDYTSLQYRQAAALSSVLGFLLGIIYITREGMYIVQLVDYFGVAMLLYVAVLLEVLSVIYGYGLRNFCWDIEYMTTRQINIWFRVVWSLIAPISLIIIFCYYLATLPNGMKMKGVEFPTIALICGWSLFFLGIVLVPGFALYHLCKRREEGCPNMFWSIFNHDKWGPLSENDNSEWKASRRPEERGNNAIVDFLKAIIRR